MARLAPLAIEMLLQYSYLVNPGNLGQESKAHANWQSSMVNMGLLEITGEPGERKVIVTDRGEAHVKQLCNLALPVKEVRFIGANGEPIGE